MSEINIDPNKAYTSVTYEWLAKSCGILPKWLSEAPQNQPIRDYLETQYHFGISPMKGSRLSNKNQLVYPGDPPLDPILEIIRPDNNKCFIYPYSICYFDNIFARLD